MVKEVLNLSVEVLTRVRTVELPLEKVRLAKTKSIMPLSVTSDPISIVSDALNLLAFGGIRLNTSGVMVSSLTKKVVSVLLMLFCVSFAMNVMLYCPISVGMVKVILNRSVVDGFSCNSCVLLFGSVMFASTVSTKRLSVMFALMFIISLMLNVLPAVGSSSVTVGGLVSSTLKAIISVLLMLFCVSFAK